jgi:hypothetical protein
MAWPAAHFNEPAREPRSAFLMTLALHRALFEVPDAGKRIRRQGWRQPDREDEPGAWLRIKSTRARSQHYSRP